MKKITINQYRKKLAMEISSKIQQFLYFIEDDRDEEIIIKFWKFLDKYEKGNKKVGKTKLAPKKVGKNK